MTRFIMLLLALPLFSCAHVNAVLKDMRECLSENPALHDVEADVGPAITHILACDPDLSKDALPECAKAGLSGLAVVLGYDGIRYIECVVGKMVSSKAASQLVRSRAKAFMIYNAKPVKPIMFSPDGGTEI